MEIPVLASKRGVQGIQTTALPPAVTSWLVRDPVVLIEIELEAYERGSNTDCCSLLYSDGSLHQIRGTGKIHARRNSGAAISRVNVRALLLSSQHCRWRSKRELLRV